MEGFHGTVFESANERLDAARDIAASVFRPYHDRLDAREYETSKLSPEEPFDIYVVMGANMNLAGAASATGEGAASDAGQQNYIDIKVKNLEEAQRIMQETGGQARITYLERHHLQAYENPVRRLFDAVQGRPGLLRQPPGRDPQRRVCLQQGRR